MSDEEKARSVVSDQEIIAELNRVKATFQLRSIVLALGLNQNPIKCSDTPLMEQSK